MTGEKRDAADSAPRAIRLKKEGRVATITVDAPPLNILDLSTLRQLESATEALANDGELQLVILRGAGDRVFSAGVSVHDHSPDKMEEVLTRFHRALLTLMELPAASIAVVQGPCLGGGMELAASCDWVLASEKASFGQPEIKLGCYPPFAAALYPARLGYAKTLDLIISGRTLSAQEAKDIGFVSWVVPAAELESALEAWVEEITTNSAAVTRLAKRAVMAGLNRSASAATDAAERLYLNELVATEDMVEGLSAFIEKRSPDWKHR